jgi:hypothetical protein
MFMVKQVFFIAGLLISVFLVVHCSSDNGGSGDAGPDAAVFDPNDIDGDGIPNDQDPDMDGDGIPNNEDPDMDGDGINNNGDNCEAWVNPDQTDRDDDGFGDPCDNCPDAPNPGQQDADNDDIGDHCDSKLDLPPLDGIITCAEQKSESTPIAANLYYLIDWSGSMWCDVDVTDNCMNTCDDPGFICDSGCTSGCPNRRKEVWDIAVTEIAPLMTSGSFNLGAGRFSGDSCNEPTNLLTMASGVTSGQFVTAAQFGGGNPSSYTPTGAALEGVREDALYNLTGDTETRRSKAVVLVTDGLPTACPGTNLPMNTRATQKAVVGARALATEDVPVYVLGFTGVQDDIMDAMSYAGSSQYHDRVPSAETQCDDTTTTDCWCDDPYEPAGCWRLSDYAREKTGRRLWYEVSNTETIKSALTEIAWNTTTCILPMDENEDADFDISSVKLIGAGACGDSPGGDCYVTESSSNGYSIDGTTVRIYGAWCRYLIAKVQNNPDVAVEARIGCKCSGVEICADGTDNDCDGETDEDCGIILE